MIKRPLCLAAVLFLGIQVFLVGGLHKWKPSPLERNVKEGETVTLSGTVYRREERPDYQTFYLTDVHVRLEKQIIDESKILVYFKQYKTQKLNLIEIGNTIQLTGKIRFFEPVSNPGNFDQKFYYQKEGMCAAVWCENIKVTDPSVQYIQEGLMRLRSSWKDVLTGCMGEYYGNCMSAILIGDKTELDRSLKELYQKSGIGHILAISGLHMSFLGIGLYQLLRKTGMSFLLAGTVGILFLVLYTLMTGNGVSCQRALIMFIIRVGADVIGRDYDLPTSLALAAAVIILRQPLYLFDAGFLLSFGALTGIAVVNPVLEKWSIIPKIFQVSIAVHLVLLPILLYYYFEIPTYSLLLNLLVIPLMSAVLGIGVLGSLTAVFWAGGGELLLGVCKFILWIYEQAAQLTVGLPFGRMILGQPEKWWCIVYYAGLFGVCAVSAWYDGKDSETTRYRRKVRWQEKCKKISSICIVVHIAMFCLGCRWSQGKQGELKVVAIDVGQGDGLYVRTPSGKHFLIDGGSTSESGVGKYRIEPFLKSLAIGKLDYVFVSHGDKDHINGIEELLKNQKLGIQIDTLVFPVETVLDERLLKLAELAKVHETEIVTIETGQKVIDGEMSLECLAPSKEYTGEIGNESSMVLELVYEEFEMLFTGDLEGEGERMLVHSGKLKDYDVLKAGHHGSKNSTSSEMLNQVQPEITIISAGKENRYGHPHKEVIERLEASGSRIYSTKNSGAVILTTDGKSIHVKTWLQGKDAY